MEISVDAEVSTRFCTVQFIAVGNPQAKDGATDVPHVLGATRTSGQAVAANHPAAMEVTQNLYANNTRLNFARSPSACLSQVAALLIVTECNEFHSPDFDAIKQSLTIPVILDGRSFCYPEWVPDRGIEYLGIGH